MTPSQKFIKYAAIAFAIFLVVVIVLSDVSVLFLFIGGGTLTEDLSSMKLSDDIHSLEFELEATSLIVKTGDTLKLETNNPYLTFGTKNGTVSVEEERHTSFVGSDEPVLILTVPEGKVFDRIELDAGAGRVEIEALSVGSIDFDLDAGEVRVGALFVTGRADIDGGAGRIEIASGSLTALDLDMGVGELDLRAALIGSSSVDCGVGSVRLVLVGAESDYTVAVSKGLGEVTVGGRSARDGEVIGSGENRLSVGGGIGEIRVTFEAE